MRDFFFLSRTAAPSAQLAPFATRRANRTATILQWVFGVWLIGAQLVGLLSYRKFTARPKSPLYGIWSIDASSTESIQWARRIVFDRPGIVAFQRSDNSLVFYNATINPERRMIVLSGTTTDGATFTYQRRDDELILDGLMNGNQTHLALHQTTRLFPLVNRGFHWVQDYPFNR